MAKTHRLIHYFFYNLKIQNNKTHFLINILLTINFFTYILLFLRGVTKLVPGTGPGAA